MGRDVDKKIPRKIVVQIQKNRRYAQNHPFTGPSVNCNQNFWKFTLKSVFGGQEMRIMDSGRLADCLKRSVQQVRIRE